MRITKRFMSFVLVFAMLMTSLSCLGGVFSITASAAVPTKTDNLDGIVRTPGQHGSSTPKTEAELAQEYPNGYVYLSGTVYEFDANYTPAYDFESHITPTDGYVNSGDYVIMLVKCTTSAANLSANTYWIAHDIDFFSVAENDNYQLPLLPMDSSNTNLESYGHIMNYNNPDVNPTSSVNYGMTYKVTSNASSVWEATSSVTTLCGYSQTEGEQVSMNRYLGYKIGTAPRINGEADMWSLGILYKVKTGLTDGTMGSIYIPLKDASKTFWKFPGLAAGEAGKRKGTVVTSTAAKPTANVQLNLFSGAFDYNDFGATLCIGNPPAQGDTYTVTFYDADGETVLGTVADVADGGTVALTDAPAVTAPAGKTFDGWVDANGNAVSFPITVTADTAVYASYSDISYTLTINYKYANGTAAATTYTETLGYNAPYSVTSPVIDGYTADLPTVSGNITDNTTVDVTYTANTYTATFYDADGTTVLGTTTAAYGANIMAISNPTSASGATFKGWSETLGGSILTNLGTMPIGGKSFYANWQAATNYIDFYDGNLIDWLDGIDCEVGAPIENYAPTNYTTPAGQSFIGWFIVDESTLELTDVQVTVVPSYYVMLAPKFEAASFTVTFNDANGNFISSQSGLAGDTIIPPNDSIMIPEGYTLSWADENNNPMPATITGNATYHAVFTANTYVLTVTYVTEDGSDAPADETYNVVYGTQYNYPATTVAGYTADPSAVTGTMPAAATTVTVTLRPISYPLTIHYYYANSTTEVFPDDVVNVLYNASYTVTPQVKYGYSYSIAPATSVSVTMDVIGGKDYIVYYGTNDVQVNIDYVYAGGGTAAPSVQLIDEFGAPYSQVSPAITGYTPDIPVVTGNFTVDTTVDPIPTITVTYTANAYTITWNLDGGEINGDYGPVVQNVAFGDAVAAPGTPTKSGFEFAGWTPALASTVPDEDLVYTATWAAAGDTPYTVTVYTMDTEGNYGAGVTTDKTGVTGADVDAASAALETGFYYDTAAAGYNAQGTIAADGSTALTVYIGRSQYDITFSIDGNNTVVEDAYFGAALTAPEAEKEGYSFTGWTPAVPATVPAENATYVAQFTVNSYPVAWTIDGATTTENVEFGTVPVAPEAAKEGYTFNGWFVTGDATETVVDAFPAVGTAGAAYTAKFTVNQYTLTFMVNGELYTEITQDYGTAVTAPEDPEMEGNEFSCWKVDGVATAVPETMPAQNITFVAAFGVSSFTFTYVIDGVSTSADYDFGATVPAIANPSKTGYTFTGWEPAWPATMPANNYTVTAQFSINEYTVYASIDGAVTEYKFDYNEEIAVPVPEKEGYTFSYWSPALPETMPANDLNVSAVFAVNKYTVAWTVDGNTTTQEVNYGVVPNAPAAAKEGYTFEGWFVTGDATETVLTEIPAVGLGGAAYTAKFTINTYTATYDLKGGNIDDNTDNVVYNVEYGAAIPVPADPVRSGYVFAGWSPAPASTIGAANVVYEAQWTQDTSYCTVKKVERVSPEFYYECGIANWEITVEGSPSRIQIYYDDTYSVGWNYSRYNTRVLPEGDLTGLVDIVTDGDNEIWTIRATIPAGGYKARAKVTYEESSWEELENGYDFTVEYDENTATTSQVISLAVDKAEIKRGATATFTVVTTDDITMIRLADKVDNSSEVTSSIGFSKANLGSNWVDNGDGTATWTVAFAISYTDMNKASELHSYTAYYYDGNDFVDGGIDPVSVNVTKYDTSGEIHEVDGEPVEPYSILNATAALGKKLTYTNLTITTTSDVTKVRLSVGEKKAVYTRASNNVTFTDNGDGTATWVIGYRFLTAGQYTIGVESRGNTWDGCSNTTVTTTIYNNNAELAAAQG